MCSVKITVEQYPYKGIFVPHILILSTQNESKDPKTMAPKSGYSAAVINFLFKLSL